MLASTILRFINSVLLLVVLARVWGPEQFGIFMYTFTMAGIIVILIDYGFNLQLVKDVAKNNHDVHRLTCQALSIKTFLTTAVLILGVPIVISVKAFEGYRLLIILILLSNILNSYGLIFNLSFRGMGKFNLEVMTVSWSTLLTFLIIGTLILSKQGPIIIALGLVIIKAFFMVHSLITYKKIIDEKKYYLSTFSSILEALYYGLPFAIHVALSTLYFSIDTIIIQHLLGPRNVGIYQAGLRVMMGGLVLADVLGNVYLNQMSKESANRQAMINLAKRMTRHFLMVGILGFICMIGFSELVVKLIYGIGFSYVISLLPLFGIVLLLRYMATSYGFILTVDDKQGTRTIGAGLSVIVSVSMNLILIPVFSLYGAVCASIITHIFLVSIYIFFVRRQLRTSLLEIRSWIIIAIAIAAGLLQLLIFSGSNIMTYLTMIGMISCICIIGISTSEYKHFMVKLRNYAISV